MGHCLQNRGAAYTHGGGRRGHGQGSQVLGRGITASSDQDQKSTQWATEHTCGIGGIRIWSLVGSKFRSTAAWGGRAISKARTVMRVVETRLCRRFILLSLWFLLSRRSRNWGNHPEEPLHKFRKRLIAMGFWVKILLTRRVFWGTAMWNFRAFRCCAASDLSCMQWRGLVAAKGLQSDYPSLTAFVLSVPRSWTCYRERLCWQGFLNSLVQIVFCGGSTHPSATTLFGSAQPHFVIPEN